MSYLDSSVVDSSASSSVVDSSAASNASGVDKAWVGVRNSNPLDAGNETMHEWVATDKGFWNFRNAPTTEPTVVEATTKGNDSVSRGL
jgi:hypothetical protein